MQGPSNWELMNWVICTQRCDVCGRTVGESWVRKTMLGKDGQQQRVKVCRTCANILMPDAGTALVGEVE